MRRLPSALMLVMALLRGPKEATAEVTMSGVLGAEVRGFLHPPALALQGAARVQPALTAEVKLALRRLTDHLDCVVNPFGRYDPIDAGRRLLDPYITKCQIEWAGISLKVGYDVEFWGVMEFVNPVNVINQRDLVDDLVSKRRLGQPMASLSLPTDWGTLDVYLLTAFRPLRLSSIEGRLRPAIPIDESAVSYQPSAGRFTPEVALRMSRGFEALAVGLSYFYGHARDPDFLVALSPEGRPYVYPSYDLRQQLGLDLQLTMGGLILKSEDVLRLDAAGKYQSHAVAFGAEYELGASFKARQSISLLVEYDFDSRSASLVLPFTHDAFAGVRLGFNDQRSTEVTAWTGYSLRDRAMQLMVVDVSMRILDELKATVSWRQIVAASGPFADVARDDHLSLRLAGYW
jgi:hypothetical protein